MARDPPALDLPRRIRHRPVLPRQDRHRHSEAHHPRRVRHLVADRHHPHHRRRHDRQAGAASSSTRRDPRAHRPPGGIRRGMPPRRLRFWDVQLRTRTPPCPSSTSCRCAPGRRARRRSRHPSPSSRRADALGYRRYWFAEHHNMPAVASTTPPVLIAAAAARTARIRVGSGGVMLPNHSPLVVAEQFAALEALAPGPHRPRHRPRARQRPGDHAAAAPERDHDATSSASPTTSATSSSLVSPDGATVRFTERRHVRRARDAGRDGAPEVWLLGLERLLGAARGIPRPAVRVREPLLGPGSRARARPVPHAVTSRARRTPSRGRSSRSTRSPRRPPKRPRRARCRSCA